MDKKKIRFAESLVGQRYDHHFRFDVLRDILDGTHVMSQNTIRTTCRPANERIVPPHLRVVPSVCYSCHSNCEVLVYVNRETGVIERVEGDPDSPQTHGVLCAKGLAAKDLCYNPGRLTKPLKRVGARWEGKFEEIGWDEALDIIADQIKKYKLDSGPESVAILQGTRRGFSKVVTRLCNLIGLPNHGAPGWAQCSWPRRVETQISAGGVSYMESPDLCNTHCLLAWGVNPPTSWSVRAADISDLIERGGALIVVDPQMSELAAKADVFLQIRPDTDLALALTMIHIIIEEDLVDHEFLDEWTTGYPQLVESVREYSAEWGACVCGVNADTIRLAARVFCQSAFGLRDAWSLAG
jgi:anaerobic selenocysteine-containing dehydrogenase